MALACTNKPKVPGSASGRDGFSHDFNADLPKISTEKETLLDKISMLEILSIMEQKPNDLGLFLAQARKKLNLSLRAVEAETDVSNAYLSQLETGKIKTPSPTVLHTLAQRYGVGYDHLMKLAGYPVPGNDVDESDDMANDLAARIGRVSPEEEDALVEFLSLIRKRTGGGP